MRAQDAMNLANHSLRVWYMFEDGRSDNAVEAGRSKWKTRRIRTNPRWLQGDIAPDCVNYVAVATTEVQDPMRAWRALFQHLSQQPPGVKCGGRRFEPAEPRRTA